MLKIQAITAYEEENVWKGGAGSTAQWTCIVTLFVF